ncbi:MAG: carboxyl-terminal processing protease [Cyclobacteriaceae bacterium]|jgi:carboxyl-terminal processing protease
MNKSKLVVVVMLLLVGLMGTSTATAQNVDSLLTLEPAKEHASQTFVIVNLLNRYHYRKTQLNDSLSSVIFNNYFESLDQNKSYFLKSDYDYFEKYRFTLDESLPQGNLDFAYQLFSIYRERSLQRLAYVDELLKTEFDFTQDEYLDTDREDLLWAQTREELNEIWRKIIKNQALSYKLAGKEWEDIAKSLNKRYARVSRAIYQYNSEDVYQAYMNSFTSAYDPHTDYFSPIAKANFQIDMSHSLEGIGARLTQQLDLTKVADIIPGGPAYRSKELMKDDKIIGVAQGESGEFIDVIGWRLDDVVQKIRGPKGTTVRLQILKGNDDLGSAPDTVILVRDKIKLEESTAKSEVLSISEGKKTYQLGVISIPNFYIDFEEMNKGVKDYTSTTRDVKKLITELQTKKVDGIMIDLRYNGGGSLQEAIELTGLFIPKGPVVQVRNTDQSIDIMEDEDGGNVFYDGPLAVLTNRYSASASEIFSGAIQDYKRGIVLGENTFGKGTVQNLIDIGRYMRQNDVELGQIKMTLAKFYRVTGSSTQIVGVAPDIAFPTPFQDEPFGEGSRPNALPWDEILGSQFVPTNTISKDQIAKLNSVYKKHLLEDDDLKNLVEKVDKTKAQLKEKSISLNLDQRKTEQSKDNEEVEDNLNTTIESNEVVIEDDSAKKLSEDPYLKEGLKLLAELSKNKIG